MFDGFSQERLAVGRGEVFARAGGSGTPLLLLHGYPQSHLMWHSVAPLLAEHHSVVVADLPGYGDSFAPVAAPDHAPHSKRALAGDLVQAMALLGHERFAIGYWHWAFLAQPAPLPEQLIIGDPDAYFDHHVRRLGIGAASGRYPAAVSPRTGPSCTTRPKSRRSARTTAPEPPSTGRSTRPMLAAGSGSAARCWHSGGAEVPCPRSTATGSWTSGVSGRPMSPATP